MLAGISAAQAGSTQPPSPPVQSPSPAQPAPTTQPLPAPPPAPPPAVRITLDEAINLAFTHSHVLKAAQTTIPQAQAEETTANLRPNPVIAGDSLFLPIFGNPSGSNTSSTVDQLSEFDLGISYLIERGRKRQHRLQAARDVTTQTRSTVLDTQRTLAFNVAQQFVAALLADSNLQFAQQDLNSFQQTVTISEERYKAGDISEADYLKIKLQLLQFQTDVSTAQVARVQALAGLRQAMGYTAVPENYDVAGDLTYTPVNQNEDDLKALALRQRPDFLAAEQGVTASKSAYELQRANGKRDLTVGFNYSHVSGYSSGSWLANMELPIFNRNQGEIARTRYAIAQAQENAYAASDIVLTDVESAYAAVSTNQQVVQLYLGGYLKNAQDSRDISEYAYKKGGASLLDFLDAERSYRATELAYRQALASYMTAVEQLKEAVGTRNLP
ncbi:MAG TPA: TolC family protein [Terriglobales bacterium]|nr:TolC family protein [Terriglobales bacterium]